VTMTPAPDTFPFDLFRSQRFPPPVGPLIEAVEPLSMIPPFPWGQWLYARVFEEQCAALPGDVVEAGVARGGMSIFLGLLSTQLGLEKRVFAVDSFEGLPAPNPAHDNPYYSRGEYAPGEGASAALASFWCEAARHGLAETVIPVPGWFDEVLPSVGAGAEMCFVHIDADLHGSVLHALELLWDRVCDGGVVAIDDFFHPSQGALRAAAEFFGLRRLSPVYHVVFPYSVFVVKGEKNRGVRSVDGNIYSLDWLRSDVQFLAALELSLARSETAIRAGDNCRLLLGVLRERRRTTDIYDYWRALEQFWEWIDVRPDEREPAERAVSDLQHAS
jgi:hypothetical protein